MHKAIEKLTNKRNKLLEKYMAFQNADNMVQIKHMREYKEIATQIHCINFVINLLGEKPDD